MDVAVTAGSSVVTIARGAGMASSDILVYDGFVGGTTVACGGPTVTTTDTINLDETVAVQNTTFFLNVENGPLAPGATNEGDGSSEIEWTIDALGNFDEDQLTLVGTVSPGNFRFGSGGPGINLGNLNGSEVAIDNDLTITSLEVLFLQGGEGNDTMTTDGTGIAMSAGPSPARTVLDALGGDDTLAVGTAFNNSIVAGAGNDSLTGGPQTDSLRPGDGHDVADGGGGVDSVLYLNHGAPVTVDLRVSTAQDTGGAGIDTLTNFEGATGGNMGDTLIGTDGDNSLFGGQLGNDTGNDTLIGLAGNDTLFGAPGNDLLRPGPGNDQVTGNAGNDTLSYEDEDAPGGGVTLSLDPALTGMAQATGGSGSDTLVDDGQAGGTHHAIENVVGTPFADVLTGNTAVNRLTGLGGADTLTLGDNDDVYDAWDGEIDTVDCGAGADSGTEDESGVDAVTNCETRDLAPQTTIDSGPADGATITDTTPVYALSSDEPASFELSVDGAAYVACAGATCEAGPLLDGPHTLAFRAVDADQAGNHDRRPAERSLTVDTTGPIVSIDTSPADTTSSSRPVFTFSAEPGATFECRFDGAAFAPCNDASGPTGIHQPNSDLALGSHQFDVRGTDAVGNVGPVASDGFTIVLLAPPAPPPPVGPPPPPPVVPDTDPPETRIGRKPRRSTRERRVRFTFSSDESGSRFQCRLDRARFRACRSPHRQRVRPGRHRFQVRAIDAAGNVDRTPASHRFVVRR